MKNSMKDYLISAIALLVALVLFSGVYTIASAQMDVFTVELREGDSGDGVLALQQRLYDLGFFNGVVNGKFGPDTTAALKLFQQSKGLPDTGVLDARTHLMLFVVIGTKEMPLTVEAAPSGAMMDRSVGIMPGFIPMNTNEYKYFKENRFHSVRTSPLSTFAADVDTASYAQLRARILRGERVPLDSVRIEEMLNYFRYDYKSPEGNAPFGVTMELANTPWNKDTQLLLIGLKTKEIPGEERPPQNLVFLIDVSGSMNMPNKLPLVKRAFQLLLEELSDRDTVSIVTYASREEVVLDGVRASDKTRLMEAIDRLEAGGATAGAAGILTAYELAEKHFIRNGNNRVLLATDGDLNVGVSDEGSLTRLVEEKKRGGVFLSVLGFGDGNYKDNKLEALADNGDGNYSYIDTIFEARRALVTEIGATFLTVAKDVKLQVDFNPGAVKGYRLLGYENRVMDAEDFADDSKDGGELGSGHLLTVLYEIVPVDSPYPIAEAESKYQETSGKEGSDDEILTLSIRAKEPQGEESRLYSYPLKNTQPGELTDNLRFAAAVAEVGMLLRESEFKGSATYDTALELLRGTTNLTGDVYKEEFLYLTTLLSRGDPMGN